MINDIIIKDKMASTHITENEGFIIEHTMYGEVGHSTIIDILEYDVCYKCLKFYARDLNATSYLETKRHINKNDKSYLLVVMIDTEEIFLKKYNEYDSYNINIILSQLEDVLKKQEEEEEED